jgi:DNA-binding beta-propeller fold protein YncE
VAVSTNGQFAYVANSGDGNVSAYTINATTGALTPVSGSPFAAGRLPYSVAVSASGPFAYVVNEGDGSVSAYTIDTTTGALSPVSGSPFSAGNGPYSVTVSSNGQFAYIALAGSANVAAYTINATTGALTPVPGSPFAAGTFPRSVAVTFSMQFAKFAATLYLATKQSAFAASETFTLGANSTGINPSAQAVTLTIGALTLNLPAGSFVPDDSPRKGYVYRGTVNGVNLFVSISPTRTPQTYQLFGIGGYAFPSGVSVMPVGLTIGGNSGSVNVTPHYVTLAPTSQ